MNIFVTEPCPVKSAQGLCDKHIPKMTLESAQMLSTAWRIHGEQYAEDQGLYKQAYLNHPCTSLKTICGCSNTSLACAKNTHIVLTRFMRLLD